MSQDAIKYERLVALAGWLWMRLRDNRPLFRRSDLLEVDRLSYLGGPEAKARKAFERAQKDLSTFGVVVEWDEFATVDNDYDNTGAFRIRGLKLTPEQQQALMGLAFSIAYRDLESGHAVKIPGAFLDGAGETLLLDANRFVAPVAEAIDDHACISFLYREATMPREAQPIRLAFERGVWYLAAFDFTRSEARTFRLDHFRSIDRTDTPWNDEHDTPETREMVARARDRFFWGGGEHCSVVLAVDPDAELAAERLMAGLETTDSLPDGRLVMTRTYSNEENMVDAVLTLGMRCEVLEPVALRERLVDHLSAMVGEAP